MTSEQLNYIYETAQRAVNSNPWVTLDYITSEQLIMFCVRVYEGYTERKVITERIFGHQDTTLIVSNRKISVILNESSQSSYTLVSGLFQGMYEYDNIMAFLEYVDITFLKADLTR